MIRLRLLYHNDFTNFYFSFNFSRRSFCKIFFQPLQRTFVYVGTFFLEKSRNLETENWEDWSICLSFRGVDSVWQNKNILDLKFTGFIVQKRILWILPTVFLKEMYWTLESFTKSELVRRNWNTCLNEFMHQNGIWNIWLRFWKFFGSGCNSKKEVKP